MEETIKTIFKIIGWIIIVPVTALVYYMTVVATSRYETQYWWAPVISIVIVAIYTLGVALRNKLGGVTLATLLATIINFLISILAYAWSF